MEYDVIKGKIVSDVKGAEKGSEELSIVFSDGSSCLFYHDQDCCETVEIEDVAGDFSDFIGQPLTMVEERISEEGPGDWNDHITWTFYEFVCPKGSVTVRWFGSSNGYYSESVDFQFHGAGEK
ncbi:MAG: hypothetical protein [Bacteriophage sp.]|nr:MAG: hypothetical protein [Bacteriophage sp.]